MAKKRTLGKGDVVTVHYEGKFDDGTIFDTTHDLEPLNITLGEGKVLPLFEEAVKGMDIGEEKTLRIKPNEGYGECRDDLIRAIPRDRIPQDISLMKNMVLSLQSPAGEKIYAKVQDFDERIVHLNLNHPLAGKNLNFTIRVVSVQPALS